MTIQTITVSIDASTVEGLDELIKQGNYTSRSEAASHAVNLMLGTNYPHIDRRVSNKPTREETKLKRAEALCELIHKNNLSLGQIPGRVVFKSTGNTPLNFIGLLRPLEYHWYTKNASFVHMVWGSKYDFEEKYPHDGMFYGKNGLERKAIYHQ